MALQMINPVWGWDKDILGIPEFIKFEFYLYIFSETKLLKDIFQIPKKKTKEGNMDSPNQVTAVQPA